MSSVFGESLDRSPSPSPSLQLKKQRSASESTLLSLLGTQYAISDAGHPQAFDTSQLRPAEDLRRPAISRYSSSNEYGSNESHTASASQAVRYPGQGNRPRAMSSCGDRSRPVSRMRSYNQAASSMEDAVFLTPNNQRSSKPQPSYQPPVTTVRVNGVDFEMMSSTVLAPPSRTATPTPKPAPVPTSPTERGRGKKTPAPQSRSRSPSPGYGALWQPEPLRERKPSILERAHARLERSLHEHLVKAGRRPQPSFKVHSVRKSPSMGYREAPVREQEREKDPSPVPDSTPWPTEDPWIKRMEKLARSPTPARSEEGGDGDMQAVALDPQQDKERENNGDYGSSMESHFLYKGRRRDGSEASQLISTRSSSDSLFLGREDSGMHNPARHSFFLSEYAQRQIAAGAETDKIAGRQQQHPSAEPQRQPESQTQLPRVQSADSLHRRGRDEEAGSHRDRHTKLSREQLEFASLPSAMGELWEPFPFDDRRNLPSQTRHSDEIERRT